MIAKCGLVGQLVVIELCEGIMKVLRRWQTGSSGRPHWGRGSGGRRRHMASHWSKPHRLDGRLKFIVPGHDTLVPMKDGIMVARAPEPHAGRSR